MIQVVLETKKYLATLSDLEMREVQHASGTRRELFVNARVNRKPRPPVIVSLSVPQKDEALVREAAADYDFEVIILVSEVIRDVSSSGLPQGQMIDAYHVTTGSSIMPQ